MPHGFANADTRSVEVEMLYKVYADWKIKRSNRTVRLFNKSPFRTRSDSIFSLRVDHDNPFNIRLVGEDCIQVDDDFAEVVNFLANVEAESTVGSTMKFQPTWMSGDAGDHHRMYWVGEDNIVRQCAGFVKIEFPLYEMFMKKGDNKNV